MTLDERIFALLSAAGSATAALIGDGDACKVYPVEAVQGMQESDEYIVYQQIASSPAETHGTEDDAEDTLDETLYQFSCYAPALARAKALRRALRADLVAPGALAEVKVTSPEERTGDEPETNAKRADLDITFFHNPQAAAA